MYENENIMDYLANDGNFKNIQVELLEEGKSVIDNNQLIANGQLYVGALENLCQSGSISNTKGLNDGISDRHRGNITTDS